ncbi:MAG TPA: ABC transporter ATP-binding protein [Candidatus Paceibacterota bacterium]|jgi:ABC-type polysaccharide/polyol phosphate transport system, ATPase component
MKPIIEVRGLGKKFIITHNKGGYVALRDVVAGFFKNPFKALTRKKKDEFWALRDVSFSVERGEVIGVIGGNGAGKSTLLKILSQITPPSEGEVILRGRVGSLLEVGTGFHPELSGRENIFLNGAILGMKKREIERKFDEIVAFAGVERFLDTPVKHYSSGMYVRLAFSVAAHMEPDILLVDEVLAVGDAEFQKKCLGKMDEITRKSGRTIFFVSHNMGAIANLCTRCVFLKNGQVNMIGKTDDVIEAYLKDAAERSSNDIAARKDRQGNGDLRITDAYLVDTDGNRVNSAISGKSISIALDYECKLGVSLKDIIIGLGIATPGGEGVTLFHTEMTKATLGPVSGSGTFICSIDRLPLVPKTYIANARITADGEVVDYLQNLFPIDVLDGDFFGTGSSIRHSLVYMPHAWRDVKRDSHAS